MNYWDKQKQLKEVYNRATNDSGVSWHEEYLKEKTKRFEAEAKYERLTRKIKENAVKEVNKREEIKVLIEKGGGNDYYTYVIARKDGEQRYVEMKFETKNVTEGELAIAKDMVRDHLKAELERVRDTVKIPEFGKLHKVDFGAGEIEVQHKMKETVGNDYWQIECEKWKDKAEKAQNLADYYGKLLEME